MAKRQPQRPQVPGGRLRCPRCKEWYTVQVMSEDEATGQYVCDGCKEKK